MVGILLLALVGIAGPSAGTAHAEPPAPLRAQLVDDAGVLDSVEEARVQTALDALHTAHGTRLSVIYVRKFDNPTDPMGWAQQVGDLSTLAPQGPAAAVLLAVAVDDRRSAVIVTRTGDIPIRWRTFSDLVEYHVEPQVNDARWADAAITFADGLRSGTVNRVYEYRSLAIVVLTLVGLVLLTRVLVSPPRWRRRST